MREDGCWSGADWTSEAACRRVEVAGTLTVLVFESTRPFRRVITVSFGRGLLCCDCLAVLASLDESW